MLFSFRIQLLLLKEPFPRMEFSGLVLALTEGNGLQNYGSILILSPNALLFSHHTCMY